MASSPNDGFPWAGLPIHDRSALVLVDIQNGFINEHTAHVPPRVRDLLAQRGEDFLVVVATRFHNPEESLYRRLLDWHEMDTKTATSLVDGLDAGVDGTLDKSTYSPPQDLVKRLASYGARHAYLAGVNTDACVYATALILFDNGLTPIVLADACGSGGGPKTHAAALDLLRRNIGETQVVKAAARSASPEPPEHTLW